MSENISNPWDEAKLKNLIRDKIEESLTLEYKGAGALLRSSKAQIEITKDISAMANSAGGILIYGISEFQDSASEHLPEKLDPIDRNEISREWLENIASQIRPRISELKIYPVQIASDSNHVGYVVEVPASNTAHQAADCRYYRRYNFQSVPMLDHEIRDVMNRKAHPRVLIKAKFVVYPRQNEDGAAGALVVEIANESDVFARHVALGINAPLIIRGWGIYYEDAILDTESELVSQKLTYSNHIGAPLFPRGSLKKIFHFKIKSLPNLNAKKQLEHFRWIAFADSMPMQSGIFAVDEIYHKMN